MNSLSKKNPSEMISSIEDIIKCYICLCKIQDACMCPYCQKLTCQRCLQKWLREKKNQCPHCRMSLKESQVIKVSFMNEVASYIEKINTNKKIEKNEMCIKHNIQYLYYCTNCKVALCSDCYMFENEHKNHTIKKISEIYQKHIQNVKKEKNTLDSRCALLNQNLNDLNEKLSEIGTFKYKKTKELNETFKTLSEKLETNIENIRKKLQSFREKISDRLVYLESNSKKINKEINDSTQSELIRKSDNIIQQIKQVNTESNDEQLFKHISLNLSEEIPNEITPQYESSYFEINNYKSLLSSQNSDIIFSPEMRINGLIWRIKLYPLGNNSARGEYISIFLELTDGLVDKSVYYYKIELINFNRKKNFAQEYSSEFANGESWGYSKFFKLDRLEKEGFIDENGKIGVKIYIRPGSYEILVRDLKNYIAVLEDKVESKNEEETESDDEISFNSYSMKIENIPIARDFILNEKERGEEKNESFTNRKKTNISLNTKKQNANNNSENDFHLLSQNSLPLPDSIKLNPYINKKQDMILKTDINAKEKENEINFKKIRPLSKKNPFQVDLSLNSDNEIAQLEDIKDDKDIFDIPSKRDNSPMVSDDSYGYIMDSLKVMDDLKPKIDLTSNSNSASKNLIDYKAGYLDMLSSNNNIFNYNNNPRYYNNNNYFNPFHFNSSSSVNNINKNYISESAYKSKYNIK